MTACSFVIESHEKAAEAMSTHFPADEPHQHARGDARETAQRLLLRAREKASPLLAFWSKLNNDWVFNLSGLLAYNFLMSIFPILLVLLAVVGFMLGDLAPEVLDDMQANFETLVPGGADVFAAVTRQLANSARPLLIIGVVLAAFTGSRLFLVLENCFGIIYRVRGREFVQQNLMAFGMLLLYLVLIPIITLASIIPPSVLSIASPYVRDTPLTLLTYLISLGSAGVSACALISAMYLIVPNRPMRLSEIWPGTLLASVLLVLYVSLFPVYVGLFLHPGNYGAVAGFTVVILLFFYYLAFILLLGAEFNSWIAGLRPTAGDPPWIYQQTVRGRDAKSTH